MQWYALVCLLILIVWAVSVKSILVFSFSAIVSFIFAQNLLESGAELDLARLFGSKGVKNGEPSTAALKPFPQTLVGCKQTLIKYILRDFVISWFENVGIGDKFVVETRFVLEEATESLYEKMSLTNVSSYSKNICIILHKHLIAFRAVKNQKLFQNREVYIQAYQSLKKRNPIQKQDEVEYLRSVVDLLLQKLVKKQTLNCKTGRLILREILAVNLLLTILDTLADPNFLNQSIINVFGEEKQESDMTTCGEMSDECFDLPKSILMACLDNEPNTAMHNVVLSEEDNEPSTKYKFNNTIIIEHEYKELVDISLETSLDSNVSKSSPNVVNKCSEKSEVGSENRKAFKEKENSSKPKGIFGVKIHPGSLMFGRNLKLFHSPLIKQLSAMKKCLDESSVVKHSSYQSDNEPSPNNVSKDLDLAQSSSPAKENSDIILDDVQSSQSNLDSAPSMPDSKVNKGSISSSYEDIDVFDFPCCNKDNFQREQGSKDECFDVENNEQTEDTQHDNIYKRCENSDNNLALNDRQYKSVSSSGDEWDTDIFEDFIEDGVDFSLNISSQESSNLEGRKEERVSLLGELAIPKAENPCLLINIPSTELIADGTWEPHKSKYTVYHIRYSNKLWSKNENVEEDKEMSSTNENNSIQRRYREFMELHHRLSNGPSAGCLKDVPKPNRKFNSPFFRLDEDVIEGRQHLLETYLKGLVTHPHILNCDDFKGFLGIGDESHTTFHRQIILPEVPRIDKKLQKKVTKIIDHIKTAFDTGPIDGDREEEYEDIRQVLGEDKLSQDDIRTFAICSSGSRLSHSCCYSGKYFQTFVHEKHKSNVQRLVEEPGQVEFKTQPPHSQAPHSQEPQTEEPQTEEPQSEEPQSEEPQAEEPKGSIPQTKRSATTNLMGNGPSGSVNNHSFPLTETVLNLICEILQDQESWVCLNPVQHAATTIFGCLSEWWLESLVGELITEEQWQHYLTLLKQTVWPRGKLMTPSNEERTKDEYIKEKEEAVQTLCDFFAGVLHLAIGSAEAIKTSARNIVESLQFEEINRQLLLEILEVSLVEIFPEILRDQDLYLSTRNC